jgi:mutator protein MutT
MRIDVVCGVFRENGRYLIARRPEDADLGGYWEFPGGKVKKGESLEEALQREIYEELRVRCRVKEKIGDSRVQQPSGEVVLTAYEAERISGKWTLNFHSEMRWVDVQELRSYQMAPLDLPLIDSILMRQWPVRLKDALALKDQGKPEEAVSLLHKLGDEYPEAGLIFYYLGSILGELGRDDEALIAYEKAIAGDLKGSVRQQVYMGLILSYWQRGLHRRGIDLAQKALEEFPGSEDLEVGLAMNQFGNKDYVTAFKKILELLAKTSESPQIQLYRSALLYYIENWKLP